MATSNEQWSKEKGRRRVKAQKKALGEGEINEESEETAWKRRVESMNTGNRKKGKGEENETEIEMKDVDAGRTEGDSGEKAVKWVRGEDDDVEEEEEESDKTRWRERYQRETQERDGE
ncbi:hypothetical protein PAMP_005828 [Pampus punctatissimus]